MLLRSYQKEIIRPDAGPRPNRCTASPIWTRTLER